MSYFYVATPYSKWAKGIEDAYQEACRQTAILMAAGVPAFSPIAHTHGIAIFGKIDPMDHGIWLPADQCMMDAAKGLIVCMMEGWEASYGVAHEIEYFERAGKPVFYMIPGSVPTALNTAPAGPPVQLE